MLVTELRDGTFFAELHLRAGERDLIVSCRPSDAIALATRTHSPLYVADDLMEAEGLVIEPDDDDVTVDGQPGRARGRVPGVPRQDPPGGLHLLERPGGAS